MSTYRYLQSKVIDEVSVKRSDGGHIRVYLHAAENVDPKLLNIITCDFADKGWQVTPFNLNGKPVLEVEGFRSEPQLIKLLEEKGWATGPSQYTKGKEDHVSFKETLKKRSLAASGVFYLIGDVSFATYGYTGDDKLNMAAGGLYGAGTLSLLGFGRKDQSDLQVRDVAKKMSQYMKDYGADIPQDCSLDSIVNDHNRGLIKKFDDVARRYPSELMNLFFAGAGACIAKSAYNHSQSTVSQDDVKNVVALKRLNLRKTLPGAKISRDDWQKISKTTEVQMNKMHKLEGKLDIGLGAMTGASGLFAMSVKEKAHDPDAEPKKGLAAAWEAIQEKPLAIAGIGYMVSTLCHAVSTTVAWNNATTERRKSVPFRAIFVAANLVAETLLAISSKGHGQGVVSDTNVDDTVIALAAETIAKQPAKMQNILIEHVARFLGQPDTLALKDQDVEEKLRLQVETMRKNPWALIAGEQSPAEPQPATTKPLPAWQAKMAAEPKTPSSPQVGS